MPNAPARPRDWIATFLDRAIDLGREKIRDHVERFGVTPADSNVDEYDEYRRMREYLPVIVLMPECGIQPLFTEAARPSSGRKLGSSAVKPRYLTKNRCKFNEESDDAPGHHDPAPGRHSIAMDR
ncbi:hypothetical protein [uncultured Bradyrhizobium sp.]|uniref:hypothetical protein n=1 Tax=uncultured Bradyrhizobium sp. TaxID=199684 RepID=UPI0035CAAE75